MKKVLCTLVPIAFLLAPLVAASAQPDVSRLKIDNGVLQDLTQNDDVNRLGSGTGTRRVEG